MKSFPKSSLLTKRNIGARGFKSLFPIFFSYATKVLVVSLFVISFLGPTGGWTQQDSKGPLGERRRPFPHYRATEEIVPGVRFGLDRQTGQFIFATARTALIFGKAAEGFPLLSLVDLPTQTEFVTPGGKGKLYRIEVRYPQPYIYGSEIVEPGPGRYRMEKAGGAACLVLEFAPQEGVRVQVSIRARAQEMFRWRIQVHSPQRTIWLVDFPCIERLGIPGGSEGEYLAFPSEQGRKEDEPRQRARYAEGWAEYPSGGKSMQFEAYCAPSRGCGLYIATEDPAMRRKSVCYWGQGQWMKHYIRHYPENMGLTTQYEQPFDIVLGTFAGEWYEACRIYRRWALKQPWSARGPVATRPDVPDWMRQLGVWCQGDIPGTTRAEMENQVQRVVRFAQEMEVPVAFHAYLWQTVGIHDKHYPILEPKPGFAQAVRDLQRHQVHVIPYYNIYSADAQGPAWASLQLSSLPLRPLLRSSYGSLEGLVPMCVAAPRWQQIILQECEKLMSQLPVDGLYLDQLTGHPYLCFAPDHGHPLGGGAHFVEGMRHIAARARQMVTAYHPQGITFGENCTECYNDLISGLLTWAEMEVGKRLPLFPAVYADHIIRFGCFIGKPDTWGDAQGYYSKLGLSFTWGEQLGWIMFGILSHFEDPSLAPLRAYLKNLAKTRVAALEYLCYGQMLPPPQLAKVPQLPVKWDFFGQTRQGKLPAVLATCWRAPNGEVAFALCNWTAEDRFVELPLTDLRWRPKAKPPRLCQGGLWKTLPSVDSHMQKLALTVPAHTGLLLEPGFEIIDP